MVSTLSEKNGPLVVDLEEDGLCLASFNLS